MVRLLGIKGVYFTSEMQWETESMHLEITLGQYQQWLDNSPDQNNPLKHVPPDKFSCYIDYKYMNEVFDTKSDILKVQKLIDHTKP